MKNLFLFSFLVCCTLVAVAQNPIATLEHTGATTVFYGQNSLVDAYNASANGDQIYLSTGYFTAPSSIVKGIKIVGAGHFPDSANVAKRTTILSGLIINAGADSLQLQGLYINGDIYYAPASSINYVKVIRCYLNSAYFQSNSATASKNYCSFEECFVGGTINFSRFGSHFLVKHCVIANNVYKIDEAALIDGNIFLNIHYGLNSVKSSLVQNNIFLVTNYIFSSCTGNSARNNIFIAGSFDIGTNSFNGNFLGIPQANIFVNQTGNGISYTHDYHLKNPETYIGTDGTQVGIYGGAIPFKEKGLPSNPQVITKQVADQTDENGNLKINFTVKAQAN